MPFPAPAPATLAAAQAGEPAALDLIARLCAPYVLRWCRRLGGPRVNAEDAAQDVLIIAYQRIRAVDGPAALGPWVFGITRRVLADHRRRAWVLRWIPGLSPDRAGAPARAELSRAASEVQALIEALPAAQREAFVLCVVEEYTDEEAAALLAIPVGTLKSRLRLARGRLAEVHQPQEPASARAWEES